MSELSRKTALLLDEAIDGREVTPPSGDDGEILGLLEVVELMRSQPETTLPSVSEASGTRGKWPTRVRVAAVVVLIVGLGAGLLVQRISQAKNDAAGERTAACFNSAHLIGRGVGLVPIGAESYVVNAAREAGDPCPQAPVRWAKESAKAAGFEAAGSSKTAYVFLLKGDFYLNPVGHRHFHRYLTVAWTAKGVSTDYHRIAMPSAAPQLWLRPRRIQTLPWAIARQVQRDGANSPIRYGSLRLGRLRSAVGDIFPTVSGDRVAYVAKAATTSHGLGPAQGLWAAVRIDRSWQALSWQVVSVSDRLKERSRPLPGAARLRTPFTFWLPARLPTHLSADERRQIRVNTFGRHPVRIDWLATTAGHLRAVDPYEEAVPEEVPRNAVIVMAVFRQQKSELWMIDTRLGRKSTWAAFGGSPVTGMELGALGPVHHYLIAHPREGKP